MLPLEFLETVISMEFEREVIRVLVRVVVWVFLAVLFMFKFF